MHQRYNFSISVSLYASVNYNNYNFKNLCIYNILVDVEVLNIMYNYEVQSIACDYSII